jgi:hypothetical protein
MPVEPSDSDIDGAAMLSVGYVPFWDLLTDLCSEFISQRFFVGVHRAARIMKMGTWINTWLEYWYWSPASEFV